jgi:ribosome-binding factor A
MSTRHERITEAIRKEMSLIVHDELKDPRLGFVTITRVDLSPDFRSARIFYGVLGKEDDYRKTQEALESASGFIRRELAQRIKLRFAPEIFFKEDRSTEFSIRIEEALMEIKKLDESKKSRRRNKKT